MQSASRIFGEPDHTRDQGPARRDDYQPYVRQTRQRNSGIEPVCNCRAALGGRNSGTDGTFSDICFTRLAWLTMTVHFRERETSRLSHSVLGVTRPLPSLVGQMISVGV